jgi:hypothetical protein
MVDFDMNRASLFWLALAGVVLAGTVLFLQRSRSGASAGTDQPKGVLRATVAAVLILTAGASAYGFHARLRTEAIANEAVPTGRPEERLAIVRQGLGSDPGVASRRPTTTVHAAIQAPIAQQRRPFRHDQHDVLSCRDCHAAGEQHRIGESEVWTARTCAACHHDLSQTYTCANCHAGANLPAPRGVAQTLSLAVWDQPRIRELPFAHTTHANLSCQDCHRTPVTLEVDRECASCHTDHHGPAAECALCHQPVESEVHGLAAHLTCTSSGCHSSESGVRPTLSRTLCLACHTEQSDHEPGRECAACHMIPESLEDLSGIAGVLGRPFWEHR